VGGWFGSGVPDNILAKCATVAQAVEVFANHNFLTLNRIKFHLADSAGGSAIAEWSSGGSHVVERGEVNLQVSTSFVHPTE